MKTFLAFVLPLCISLVPFQVSADHQSDVLMSIDPDQSAEAQELQACIVGGRLSLPCGCWGPAMPGQGFPSPTCCSGEAVAQMCYGACPFGGAPYRLRCTYDY